MDHRQAVDCRLMMQGAVLVRMPGVGLDSKLDAGRPLPIEPRVQPTGDPPSRHEFPLDSVGVWSPANGGFLLEVL
jgi:hypothetical protein